MTDISLMPSDDRDTVIDQAFTRAEQRFEQALLALIKGHEQDLSVLAEKVLSDLASLAIDRILDSSSAGNATAIARAAASGGRFL